MKKYPSIPRFSKEFIGKKCISFYKLDGSCLACEWSAKKGFHKWSTRNHLFDENDRDFGCAIPIFNQKYANDFAKVIKTYKAESVILFMEFLGPNSFAGIHEPSVLGVKNNDPKDLVVFDVNVHKKGILSPVEFINKFGHLNIAKKIYEGILTIDFVSKVRNKELPVEEGVVCKFGEGHKLQMCKIKTLDYLKKIQKFFGTNWSHHWE